jgi:hypothetical protein
LAGGVADDDGDDDVDADVDADTGVGADDDFGSAADDEAENVDDGAVDVVDAVDRAAYWIVSTDACTLRVSVYVPVPNSVWLCDSRTRQAPAPSAPNVQLSLTRGRYSVGHAPPTYTMALGPTTYVPDPSASVCQISTYDESGCTGDRPREHCFARVGRCRHFLNDEGRPPIRAGANL